MTKNENDKNRVRFRKQNSGHFNRKVKQRKDETEKSLVGSISRLFDAKKIYFQVKLKKQVMTKRRNVLMIFMMLKKQVKVLM